MRHRIIAKDGSPTNFFWSDKDGSDRTQQTVYRRTPDGSKRIKNVKFDATKKRFTKV
ncbi:MAG: hypothetical protein WEF86_02535 [Gemmatimonadota bacterium]